MGNPPRVRVGFGEVRSTKFGDHGGSGRRSSPVGVVWAVPVLGFGRKRAWEHAQDATRPRIRPVWPSAQRRGVCRGAAVLDRRCAVPGLREIGLGRWRARREREEWAGERLGRAEGSGWCFGFLGFLFYFFFFSISNQIQLIEFKLI